MNDKLKKAREMLRRVFGHQDFIGKQQEVIEHILNGGNSLALMPTGGGKSLCYQIPALVFEGTAIVVSPLIALMKDQVDTLQQYNVRAAYLNSSLTTKQAKVVYAKFFAGDLDLLYIAPERLMTESGLDMLQAVPIALIAIDEAHCVSHWGHDFRPEYLRLGELATLLPNMPRLALTATADGQTRQEIIDKLYLQDAKVTIASFDRPSIRYSVLPKNNTKQQFLNIYRKDHQKQSGIIYCLSRKRTEETAQWLEAEGVHALPYHAGMTQPTRQRHQDIFLHEEGVVICATIAFGMGIDKPDVRFVAHFDLPKSIEGYYQESGRAGRDGLAADAILFYGLADVINIRKMVDDSNAPEYIRRIERQKLNHLLALCESARCRRALLLSYFGETYDEPCNNCDNCLSPPEVWDGTESAQKFLSTVARTRQMFGVTHIVDVLLGKETDKVKKFNHQRLSTFRIGTDTSATEWRQIARQMIAADLLHPDDEYGALKLTQQSWAVMRNEERAFFRREQKPTSTRSERTKPSSRPKPETALDEWQMTLFEALRDERKRLSQQQNVPAYIIFHDTVLIELARISPKTIDDFAKTPGIGAAKVDRYAKNFLNVLKKYQQNR